MTAKPAKTKTAKTKTAKAKSGWGGKRAGAGRKPGPNPGNAHRARPEIDRRHPLEVTIVRVKKGMPSFRAPRVLRIITDALKETSPEDARESGFRIVRFKVDVAELVLVVEADDQAALTRGMMSVTIRVARRINAALGRKGHVWGDRYRIGPAKNR